MFTWIIHGTSAYLSCGEVPSLTAAARADTLGIFAGQITGFWGLAHYVASLDTADFLEHHAFAPRPARSVLDPAEGPPSHPDNLGRCAADLVRYTGLTDATCIRLAIAIMVCALCGAPLHVAGHIVYCAAWQVLAGYGSNVIVALDVAARILAAARQNALVVPTLSWSVSGDTAPWLNATATGSHVVIGTDGPYHGAGPGNKSLAILDRIACAIRGLGRPEPLHLAALLGATSDDLAAAIDIGRSVAFGALSTLIRIGTPTTIPAGLPGNIQNLRMCEVVSARYAVISAGGKPEFMFEGPAAAQILDAVRGRPHWADDLRQVAGIAAALTVIEEPDALTPVTLSTAERALGFWQESAELSAALAQTSPSTKEALPADVVVKALRVRDYCTKTSTKELSPRDVVNHGLAENVAAAKVLLAVLEQKGLGTQKLYVQNNRALQKWEVHGPRIPTLSSDRNTAHSTVEQNGQAPRETSSGGE